MLIAAGAGAGAAAAGHAGDAGAVRVQPERFHAGDDLARVIQHPFYDAAVRVQLFLFEAIDQLIHMNPVTCADET